MSRGHRKHSGYQYKEWQARVLEKGCYKCAICGSTKDLTCDHIIPVSVDPELTFDVDNGRILCDECRQRDMLEGIMCRRFKIKKQHKKEKPDGHAIGDILMVLTK